MCLIQFLYAEAWGGKKFLECKDCPIKAECSEYEPKEQTMRASKEHKQWLKERDEAIYSFDIEKFKAFYRKWQKRGIYDDTPLPSDAVIEISMRKMCCGLANPREDKLAEARAWLSERGYSWTI